MEEIQEEYEDIREDHYDNLKERKFYSIEEAREKKLRVEWNNFKPSKPSVFVFNCFSFNEKTVRFLHFLQRNHHFLAASC